MSQACIYSKTNKGYNHGHSQAIIVMVGRALGLETFTAETATDMLNDKPVHSMFSARVSKEATAIHNQIAASKELVNKANQVAQELKVQFGFLTCK